MAKLEQVWLVLPHLSGITNHSLGKTKWAYDTYPKLYRKPCDTRWFDKYIGQKCLLVDDFGGASSKMSLNYLLQLLDRYPIQVEVKCDYVDLQSTDIVITTNLHPQTWYNYEKRKEQYNALARRVHQVLWFKEFGKPAISVSVDTFFHSYWEDCADSEYLIEQTEEQTESTSQDSPSLPLLKRKLPEPLKKVMDGFIIGPGNCSSEPIDLTSEAEDSETEDERMIRESSDDESYDSCTDLFD